MPDLSDPRPDPAARSGPDAAPDGFHEAFGWHPEPELLGIRDADVSREALRAAGAATWETALDYLYDHALVRGMGEPAGYAAPGGIRSCTSGPGRPGTPAPLPLSSGVRDRVAPTR
jgi:hypothetical protein